MTKSLDSLADVIFAELGKTLVAEREAWLKTSGVLAAIPKSAPAGAVYFKTVRHEPTEAQQLSDRSPDNIIDEAIEHAEAILPHGIELLFERDLRFLRYVITAQCPHCGKKDVTSDVSKDAIEGVIATEVLAALFVQGVRSVKTKCIDGVCCDPLDRFVDGLRVRECLWMFQQNQRAADLGCWTQVWSDGKHRPLTTAQLTAARSAWSSALRAKQAEAREKERREVVCERDEEGE
jgi:hypothetical protein